MKRIAILFFITFMLIGCQPTPEQPIVVGKDQSKMLEQAKQTDEPKASTVQTVTEVKEAFTDHGVSVEVDAAVSIPSGGMPIVRVHGVDFSQETVDRFWTVLIGDTPMYPYSDNGSSNDQTIGPQMITRDDGVTMLTALENPNGEWWKRDGKKFHILNNRKSPYGKNKPLSIDAELQYSCIHTDEEYYDNVNDSLPITDLSYVPDGVKLTIIPDEAMRQASDWIDRLDIPFVPMQVYAVKNEAKECAYLIECVRTVNGIPMAVMDGYSRFDPKTSVSVDWHYENMKLLISDAGLLGLKWESPMEIDDTVVDTSKLLPFDQIMDVFRKMMTVRYASSFEDRTEVFCIGEIRLALVRVMEQNVQGSGLLIPVWCFNGKQKTESNTTSFYCVEEYGCKLMVNAIDGSIIDPEKGY